MPVDALSSLRIENLRSIKQLDLDLRGLNVLIGDNGSGKSSIIEACEILRRASSEAFYAELHSIHGGLFSLLRHGTTQLTLGASLGEAQEKLRYEITLAHDGQYTTIASERLELGPLPGHKQPLRLIQRDRQGARVYRPGGLQPIDVPSDQLALIAASGPFAPHPGLTRMRRALAAIEVHVPFEVTPPWVAASHGRKSEARGVMQLQRVERLERLGGNLPNVFSALRNEFGEAHWDETLDYIRLGLGPDVETINLRAGPAGGSHALWLKLRGREAQIPASALSDGMLGYLAFVALFRLPRPERTLLAFDEPELHLHPELLIRVLEFFERMSTQHPVLLATHADRLLDALTTPAEAVRICDLDEPPRTTRLRRLDPEQLSQWLTDYRGVGDLRSAGYLPHVTGEPEPTAPATSEEIVSAEQRIQS
jgi:predicted ATPase